MNETMGDRIKKIRKKERMTQQILADKVFISESYMAMIESGKRNPSTDVVVRIAEALGVSADYLLFGEIPKNELTLFTEWQNMMQGHSADEIASAQKIVKTFFDTIDTYKK